MDLGPHLLDQFLHPLGFRIVQTRRRLVEKEQLGIRRQGDADFEDPLIPIGQVARNRLLLPSRPMNFRISTVLARVSSSTRRFRCVLRTASQSVSLSCMWWPVRMFSRTDRLGKREVI